MDRGGGLGTSTSWSLIGTMGQQATGRETTGTLFGLNGAASSYPRCTSPVLTAVPASGQVALTWTASTCSGGWTFSSYQVCSGTAADTYAACTSAAAALTSTPTATPGVAMFYRIRVIATGAASSGSPAGNVASRSNETPATAGGTSGSSGSSGGSSGGGTAGGGVVTNLNLTKPNGGEQLISGSTSNVTWTSTGSGISTIRLRLSGDGGLNFSTTIATNESNDGTYTWTAPALTGSQFRVMVEGLNAAGSIVVSDISDGNFSIGPSGAVPPPTPTPQQQPAPPPPPRITAPSVVNNVAVTLSGVAYPSANVTILRDGTNVGFVTADHATGVWSMTMRNLTPGGLYTFVFQATDSSGNRSATTTRTVNLPTNAPAYEIENLLAPPTATASAGSVQPGEPVTFSGQAAPGTSLTAEIGNLTRVLAIAGNGMWEVIRSTVGLSGSLSGRARVSLGTETSGWSTPVIVAISGSPVAAPVAKSADLSGDNRVNLTDFSRLVSFWNKPNPPAQDDLNGDGKINLRDLSILLSHWTG